MPNLKQEHHSGREQIQTGKPHFWEFFSTYIYLKFKVSFKILSIFITNSNVSKQKYHFGDGAEFMYCRHIHIDYRI